jgi:S1-C subfamily serine protease
MLKGILLLLILVPETCVAQLTAKDILAKNKDAIVQIFVNGIFSGTGFIVSKDGLIATANHVVTTESSYNFDFFPNITVKITRDAREHPARAACPVTTESKIHDVAMLKIEAAELPVVVLGDWNEVQEADPITVISSLLGYGEHLIVTGIVSGKGEDLIPDTPRRVRTIIFQAPVRAGFSGSPLFSSSSGRVIGIVTTKVFGISNELETIRNKAEQSNGIMSAEIVGINFAKTIRDLIDTMHSQLVSGLGSAVDISYVKEMQAQTQGAEKRH